jgi:hypothetical protein
MGEGVLQAVIPGVLLALGGGALLGWLAKGRVARAEAEKTRGQSDEATTRTRREAEDRSRSTILAAKEEWLQTKARLEQEIRARSQDVQQAQRSLEEREAAQRDRYARLVTREQEIETRERYLESSSKRAIARSPASSARDRAGQDSRPEERSVSPAPRSPSRCRPSTATDH